MKVLKTVAIITVGAAAGLLIANKLTDGAVKEAMSEIYHNIVDKGEATVDAVADGAMNVAEAVKA